MSLQLAGPAPLITSKWLLRPQRLEDNASDHAAVMANRLWLRRWSGSTWPADDFSLDENLADIKEHIDDHQRGEAFGYSVLEPTESEILGSLYVQSLSELLELYGASSEQIADLSGCEARVDAWTRLDREEGLLAELVSAADRWLLDAWGKQSIWCARVDCPELESAYTSAGLVQCARLVQPQSGRVQLLFGR